MSVVAETPALPLAIQKSSRTVVWELARVEGRRSVRHPIYVVGALFGIASFLALTWTKAPVLHRDDTQTGAALLPLAIATLLVANLGALRAHRHRIAELYSSFTTSARTRTHAHLVSLLWPVAGAVVIVGVMMVWLLVEDPVGTPNPFELLVGPLMVALYGAIGIAVARYIPHPAWGPVVVVALGAVQVVVYDGIARLEAVYTRLPWLAPWVPLSLTSEVPPELVIRPAGWHALYLVGLVGIVGVVAVARHGIRAATVIGLAVALTTALGAGLAQLRRPSPDERRALASLVLHPEQHQICEERMRVSFCAYPAYARWIDRWAAPVLGVVQELPEKARPKNIAIHQRFGSYFEGLIDVPERVLDIVGRAENRDLSVRTSALWGRGTATRSTERSTSVR